LVKAGYSENTTPVFRRERKLDNKTDVTHYGMAKLEFEKDGYIIMTRNKWSSYRRARYITVNDIIYYGGKNMTVLPNAAYYGEKY